MSGMYDRIADLPLRIERYELDPFGVSVGAGWERLTTVIHLYGDGQDGVGEDVTYGADDQRALRHAGATLPLAGRHTVAGFSELLDGLALWPEPPTAPAYVDYRRWAYESAALDLALRQNGLTLAGALGLDPKPVRFCASMGLGDPATVEPVRAWHTAQPGLHFKLDATPTWGDELIAELAATGAVDVVDMKGFYENTPVDNPADPDLYRRVAEGFPEALLEDARLTDETRAVLEAHAGRLSWDAPIHSVGDISGLELRPLHMNIKPSRFGPLRRLFAAYEHCAGEGIAMYGGGQFELGPGRGQIQYLASLFHPAGANDVAPVAFNLGVAAGLPESPLPVAIDRVGFRWQT
jgi:hypothetical protein